MKINLSKVQGIVADLLIIVCLFYFLSACELAPTRNSMISINDEITTNPTPTANFIVVSQSSCISSTDTYKEIIEKSEIIIIGSVMDTGITFNGARMGNNLEQAVPTLYGLDRIYEVKVDQYLKGSGPDTFFIIRAEGLASALTAEELQAKVQRGEFEEESTPLNPDTPYLMFLRRFPEADQYPEIPKGVYYIRVSTPWLFDISNPESVMPILTVCDSYSYPFRVPLEDVMKYIQQSEIIPPTPTPADESVEEHAYPYP